MDVDTFAPGPNTDQMPLDPSSPQIKSEPRSNQLASALLSAMPRERKPQLYDSNLNAPASPTASSSKISRPASPRTSPPLIAKPETLRKPPPAARTLSSIAMSDAEDADGESGDLSADDVPAAASMDEDEDDDAVPAMRPRKGKAVVFDSDDDAPKTPRKPVLAKTSSPARSSPAKRATSAILVLSDDDDSDAAPAKPSAKALGKRRAVAPASSDSDIQVVAPLPKKPRASDSPEPDPALQIALQIGRASCRERVS